MSSVDVLEASAQWGRVAATEIREYAFFSARSSKTASTTMSTASRRRSEVVGMISEVLLLGRRQR